MQKVYRGFMKNVLSMFSCHFASVKCIYEEYFQSPPVHPTLQSGVHSFMKPSRNCKNMLVTIIDKQLPLFGIVARCSLCCHMRLTDSAGGMRISKSESGDELTSISNDHSMDVEDILIIWKPHMIHTAAPPLARHLSTMTTTVEAEALDLEAVPVRVKNVNFDGLLRTKGDFVAGAVKEIFLAKTFGDLISRVQQAQDKLNRLETFREVGTVVDVHKIAGKEDYTIGDDYDVTFIVKEFSRLAASAKTQMGAQMDAQVKTGLRMPNVFGRGEKLEVEYSYSSGSEKNAEISFVKPFPQFLESSFFKTSVFQTRSSNVHGKYLNKAIGSITTYNCSTFLQWLAIHHKVEWEATWRELVPKSLLTPLSIRLECGHAFKSALRYTVTVDTRNRQVFPAKGTYINVLQELAGLGGDVKYHKVDVDLQYNYPLPLNMTFQSSFRAGTLTPLLRNEMSCGIADRFFMGGPYSLRGFSLRGVKVGEDGLSLGGLAHWSAAAHLYTPLPSVNRKIPIIDNCRLHFFINAGNLADKLLMGNIIKDLRIAYGAGVAVGMGDFARIELNYCLPIKHHEADKPIKGFQVGVGIHFL